MMGCYANIRYVLIVVQNKQIMDSYTETKSENNNGVKMNERIKKLIDDVDIHCESKETEKLEQLIFDVVREACSVCERKTFLELTGYDYSQKIKKHFGIIKS